MNKIYFVNYIQELLYYTRLWTEGGCIVMSLHDAVAHLLSSLCAPCHAALVAMQVMWCGCAGTASIIVGWQGE